MLDLTTCATRYPSCLVEIILLNTLTFWYYNVKILHKIYVKFSILDFKFKKKTH